MGPLITLKYEDGVFVPLTPLPDLQEGDTLEFLLPDPNIVYLCKTDKLAALDNGRVIWTAEGSEGADIADD
jgi:hypothetical protein